MREEIKELYIQLLKYKRTIEDLKRDNRDTFNFKVEYVDLGCYKVESDFEVEKIYSKVLAFLYPDQQWQ